MMNKQSQNAGDNSTNYQAQNITVISGIDEKRAREVYQEMSLKLKEEFAQEALKVANSRVSEFESILLPKMEKMDGAFEAFADPSFQILLLEAQKTAASTERPADYDLLSELLVHRFQKGDDRIVRAGISRAVEIVDEISDEALIGLTVFHTITNITPATGSIIHGLKVLDRLFNKMLYKELPLSSDWLDHLDLLDAIRINPFLNLISLEEYYTESLHGYIDVGIKKGSKEFTKAVKILKENQLMESNLIEHELNSNFMRIPVPNRDSINNNDKIPDKQKKALNNIYDLYSKNNNIKKENISKFIEQCNKNDSLKIVKNWFDSLNVAINITSVGRVLAHANAQRCEKNIPALD